MKKENFCKLIQAIKKLEEDREMLAESIEKIIDGYAIVTLGDETITDIVDFLEDEMNDNNEWISWWLYEDVKKVIWNEKDEEIEVKTAEQLYDFLKGE